MTAQQLGAATNMGFQGQLRLRNASVLIVGLGGLGCPAAQYLAGAGVGTLGLVDGDTVEVSNLHRQVLHSTDRVGWLKVESARESLLQLNPKIRFVMYPAHLLSTSALDIFENHDLILDCTDHPTSRYLISDAAVLSGKPLVSASALRTDGQLLVLNNPPTRPGGVAGGPCYRCIFPKPPPADTLVSCGEGGILGPVVGVMGVLMALEAIKVLVAEKILSSKNEAFSMLIFSAMSSPPFRSLRMRGKRKNCVSCSSEPVITRNSLLSGSLDYVQFCGLAEPVNILSSAERIGPAAFRDEHEKVDPNHVLIDVRDEPQYGICSLPDSINIPWEGLQSLEEPDSDSDILSKLRDLPEDWKIYTICRLGNDSQFAVQKLRQLGYDLGGRRWIGDVAGGFKAWKTDVDPRWPEY